METTSRVVGGGLHELLDGGVAVEGVVEEDVALAEGVEDGLGLAVECLVEADFAAGKLGEFEVGPIDDAVEVGDAGEVDLAVGAEDLPAVEVEVDAEELEHALVGAGFDFEPDDVALAAVVQLFADGLEQRAGLFFLQVEIAVASDAEGCAADDGVAGEEALGVGFDEFLQGEDADIAVGCGQQDPALERAGDVDDAEHRDVATLAPEEESEAEGLVEDARKRVGGVDGDGGEQRVDFALVIGLGEVAFVVAQAFPAEQMDALVCECGLELADPAVVLRVRVGVEAVGEAVEALLLAEAIVVLAERRSRLRCAAGWRRRGPL